MSFAFVTVYINVSRALRTCVEELKNYWILGKIDLQSWKIKVTRFLTEMASEGSIWSSPRKNGELLAQFSCRLWDFDSLWCWSARHAENLDLFLLFSPQQWPLTTFDLDYFQNSWKPPETDVCFVALVLFLCIHWSFPLIMGVGPFMNLPHQIEEYAWIKSDGFHISLIRYSWHEGFTFINHGYSVDFFSFTFFKQAHKFFQMCIRENNMNE